MEPPQPYFILTIHFQALSSATVPPTIRFLELSFHQLEVKFLKND